MGFQLFAFSESIDDTATFNAATIYSMAYSIRDQFGRLVEKTGTVEGGAPTTLLYEYDFAGRLERVTTTGAASSVVDYAYDDNGNRLSRTVQGSPPEAATYDDQDRLVSYGTLTFTYNENGDLESKTDTMIPETTNYVYDARGNLRSVTLPDTTVISYDHDARDRRVVRRVNGSFDFGLVYGDALNPVAEVDASGAVVSRFVYGSRSNVPDYMVDVASGNTYRLLSDHLGSVRLVVDVSSGVVAQRIDYDEFGNVTAESGSGFQPFGFAGGLYDTDTDLVRFGARDYDPRVGRWTSKDPIRFAGGDANLYGYVLNDPVNEIDPEGLASSFEVRLAVAIARGNVPRIQNLLAAGGLTAKGTQQAQQALARLQSTASQILANECKGSVRGRFPGQFLNSTLAEIRQAASKGDSAARTADKLLTDLRFKK